MRPILIALAALISATAARAETLEMKSRTVTEWKAVYGRVEARDMVPARARIGGVVVELLVSEGDEVKAGQKIATVRDDKLAFQIAAIDAQLQALSSQMETAEADLKRGNDLVGKGVMTRQRVDQLQTQVDVVRGQIAATQAQRAVLVQQGTEGEVLAPAEGRVLKVPVTRGAVIMGGEPVATIGGGGLFLRLAIPERHAGSLKADSAIRIQGAKDAEAGRLAKIYPQIENGRVIADVEVEGLDTSFVDARLLVEVPVGEREALFVPRAAVSSRSGLDFVKVETDGGESERVVILGEGGDLDGTESIEILSGLRVGDKVITGAAAK
ncbi:MAG: efflux RND transporter periplasmic adaptor subunit [Nitratireductor sp.]|nr:efflux RND transporter periplasmic adaptor subunit [Nitratireductor sp.]MCB1460492.1 efflux RND transporter periplasmic adaptor subunit [Nitratireductor sp.]